MNTASTLAPRLRPLPPLFVSHGSPMTALEPGATGAFFQRLGPVLTQTFGRPALILAISAHSLSDRVELLGAAQHAAVADFGGFDPRLYRLRYDVAGDPAQAQRIATHLRAAGIDAVNSSSGGLDHGIWTPLRWAWPAAEVPVLPLAWPAQASPQRLMALGRALSSLPSEGVLVLATGSITHNLGRVFATGMRDPDLPPTAESSAFRQWWAERSAAADWAALQDYRRGAPHAVLMHPSDEHLLPLFVAAGAATTPEAPVPDSRRLHAGVTYGDLGMDAYAFGPSAAALHEALGAERSIAAV